MSLIDSSCRQVIIVERFRWREVIGSVYNIRLFAGMTNCTVDDQRLSYVPQTKPYGQIAPPIFRCFIPKQRIVRL